MSHIKIRSLAELQEILPSLRAGKKIVHCHGVFDLLHVGHIRHFSEAKKIGDVLVVTLTPDRFVNKGPHRPAFSEALRAEAIAALKDVDFVAINLWPSAEETIQMLRPDFYVKGSDYSKADDDVTGGILRERQAVENAGGQIVFTDDITFSSSELINRYLPNLPETTREFIGKFKRAHSIEDIWGYLDRAVGMRVLLVGETIIDEYHYCTALGKSSKEPMLAVQLTSTERFAGGILAAANHAAAFCDTVTVLSFLGDRNSEEDFIRSKLSPNINADFLYRKNSPTIVKRRFIESYFFTKLLAVYEMNDAVLSDEDDKALCDRLNALIPDYDLVIVIDYGHSMITDNAIACLEHSRFLAVNAQSNAGNIGYHTISKYPNADLVCLAEAEMRQEARNRYGDLSSTVATLAADRAYEQIIVTRGKNGCLCCDKAREFTELPALAGEVLDRMGAGDTFLVLAALCAAQDAPLDVAGFLGNVAGAHAVATVGNREPVNKASFAKALSALLK